jgi:hypothetical protein
VRGNGHNGDGIEAGIRQFLGGAGYLIGSNEGVRRIGAVGLAEGSEPTGISWLEWESLIVPNTGPPPASRALTLAQFQWRERVIWFGLVILGLIWGFFTALSFYRVSFWLRPATAVFGVLGILVLCATVLVGRWERQRPAP